jgi:hypothetical protein
VNNKPQIRTLISLSSLGNFGLKESDSPHEGAHFMTRRERSWDQLRQRAGPAERHSFSVMVKATGSRLRPRGYALAA